LKVVKYVGLAGQALSLSFLNDPLSMVMAALALLMAASVSIYTLGYADRGRPSELKLFILAPWAFCFFSCLAVFTGDWFFFALFMELSTLVLFFMIIQTNFRTALYYLLAQLAGSLLLLTGTALLISETGTSGVGPVPSKLLWFFIPGLGIKAALPVLHFWLPKVHSEAPTPASALLSGLAVKLGVYGLARLASPDASRVLLVLGIIMALYGVFQALMQYDAKRLLAYHTISQLGYVVSALGAGTSFGIAAAAYHSVAHALFKGLLFLSVGTLEKAFGTRDLRLLGRGAAQYFPVTFGLFMVGALAISGFPGMSGFASKAMVKASLKEGSHYAGLWALQAVNVGTVLSFCKLGYFGFFATGSHSLHAKAKELPKAGKDVFRNAGMALLAVATVALGVFPEKLPAFLQLHFSGFFERESILSAVWPFLVGCVLFVFFRGLLTPAEHEIPDVDRIVSKLAPVLAQGTSAIALLHSGKLRYYIATVIFAALLVFFFLSGR
jgi:multicomponent Na+:H+ antiporter subunit D